LLSALKSWTLRGYEGCAKLIHDRVNRTNNPVNLTRQQQMVVVMVILLFLIGWTVKAWRIAHPPVQAAPPAIQ